jgi:integrase
MLNVRRSPGSSPVTPVRPVTRTPLDLRLYTSWCQQHHLHLFAARRADIECFGRDMEARGRARATVARRLCTIAVFYRYAVEEGLLEHSPAVHVRRPRLDYESHATALDRNEVGGMLVAAGLGHPREHALISLLAINGLRISEALSADIDKLGLERGHRTLTITRKGGKIVTIPVAPTYSQGDRSRDRGTARRADLPHRQRATARSARRRTDRAPHRHTGLASPNQSDPTPCATRSPQPWTQASHCATSRRPPHTQTHGRQCATTEHASASTATPPTSSRPTSEEPPDNPSDAAGAQRRQHIAVDLRAWARSRTARI